MPSDTDSTTLEPDLIGALRNHWKLLGAVAAALAVVGLLFGSIRPTEWRATASVIVEDPRNSTLFEGGTETRPERYVETQIGILSSPAVAQETSTILANNSPPIELSTDEILEQATVAAEQSSDLISVTFTGNSADEAELAADAMITAYLELRRSEAVAGSSAALDELDRSIANGQSELDELEASIRALSKSPLIIDLERQYQAAFATLDEFRNSETDLDPTEVNVVSEQLDAIETAIRIEGARPELAALLEEQSLAMARQSSLVERRNEVAVDSELAGGGLVFQSPARPAVKTNPSPRAFGLVGGVIGAMAGVAFVYGLAVRRRRVDSREEPELILRSPLLGSIPRFDYEVDTLLPVARAPDSQAAEAFRFVMAAVESQLSRPERVHQDGDRGVGDRTIFVTSTAVGDGRSTVIANMGIAAARSGRRVLVLDADFSSQGLTSLLLPETEPTVGITEVVVGTSALEQAINVVPTGAGLELYILSRGSDILSAQDLFSSSEAADILQSLRDEYDLVLIDSPPFLQVGYATTLARLADRVLVVVRHKSLVSGIEELRKRLSLIHSRDIGYVYNGAPFVSEILSLGRHAARSEFSGVPTPSELSEALAFENFQE